MLRTKLRTRPCRDRASRVSSGRPTITPLSSTLNSRPDATAIDSLPFGPSTCTAPEATFTLTPAGNLSGTFPRRDTSPNLAQELAADVASPCFAIAHQAQRRREDAHTEPVSHRRNLRRAGVHAQARLADTPHARDHRVSAGRVRQQHGQRLLVRFAPDDDVAHVALAHEHTSEILLHARPWHRHLLVTRELAIA